MQVCVYAVFDLYERSFYLQISIPNVTIPVRKLFCTFVYTIPPIDYIFVPFGPSNMAQRVADVPADPMRSSSPLSSVPTTPYTSSCPVELSSPNQDDMDNGPKDTDVQKNRCVARVPRSEKLRAVLDVISQNNMSIADFIESFLVDQLPGSYPPGRRQNDFRRALERPAVRAILHSDSPLDTIHSELDALVGAPWFNNYEGGSTVGELNLDGSWAGMTETAPTWASFLDQALCNRRGAWDSYKTKKKDTPRKEVAYFVTSIILRQRARKRSNYLLKMLGMYLHSSGTKRRVINTLSGLGMCDSYKIINKTMSAIADDARQV